MEKLERKNIKKTVSSDESIRRLAEEKIQKIREKTNQRLLERIKFDACLSKFE